MAIAAVQNARMLGWLLMTVAVAAPPSPRAAPCGRTRLAPPSFEITGGRAVPIDAVRLDVDATLDAGQPRVGAARSRLVLRLGPESGFPFFDLRQPRSAAWLDGDRLDVTRDLVRREPSLVKDGGVLVLLRALPACSEHTLVIEHGLDRRPGLPVLFASQHNDLEPGGYLERWFPAPVGSDAFAFTLALTVDGAPTVYDVLTNGRATRSGRAAWRLMWPDAIDVSAPFFALLPRGADRRTVADDNSVVMHAIGDVSASWHEAFAAQLAEAERCLASATARFGPRRWGATPFGLVTGVIDAGMEYTNAATVGLTRAPGTACHEVTHAWFGRSLIPARAIDAWFDEGLAVVVGEPDRDRLPLDPWSPEAEPVARADPWTRETFRSAYDAGARVFETLYERFGQADVDDVLRDLVARCAGRPITHHDLRRAFLALGDADFTDTLFERWVIAPGDAEILGACTAIGGAP